MFEVHTAVSHTGYTAHAEYRGLSKWHKEQDFVRYCNMMDSLSNKWCHHEIGIKPENGLTSILVVSYEGEGSYRREVGRTKYIYAKRKSDLDRHLLSFMTRKL